jgi:hypothetical protein
MSRVRLYEGRRTCIMGITEKTKDFAWIQCTQCGWGTQLHREDVESGDYTDRQACPECDLGPCIIDWTYPDGRGWVA